MLRQVINRVIIKIMWFQSIIIAGNHTRMICLSCQSQRDLKANTTGAFNTTMIICILIFFCLGWYAEWVFDFKG